MHPDPRCAPLGPSHGAYQRGDGRPQGARLAPGTVVRTCSMTMLYVAARVSMNGQSNESPLKVATTDGLTSRMWSKKRRRRASCASSVHDASRPRVAAPSGYEQRQTLRRSHAM